MKEQTKDKQKEVCKKCKGLGYIFEGKGKSVHTCWDCLKNNKLN